MAGNHLTVAAARMALPIAWFAGPQPFRKQTVTTDRNGSHSAEGFFGILKRERVNRRHYRSIAEARSDVFHYIERFHNPGMQQRLDAEDQKFLALTQLATKTELNPTPGGLIMNSNESHIPLGWPPVIPRLSVANPSMCVNFLREVFGAQGTFNTDRPSEMRIGESLIMVGNVVERQPTSSFLYIYVADTDQAFEKALSLGAKPIGTATGNAIWRSTSYGRRSVGQSLANRNPPAFPR